MVTIHSNEPMAMCPMASICKVMAEKPSSLIRGKGIGPVSNLKNWPIMISATLFDAAQRIDHYLNQSEFHDTYQGETRERISKLRDQTDGLRIELGAPPLSDSEVAN